MRERRKHRVIERDRLVVRSGGAVRSPLLAQRPTDQAVGFNANFSSITVTQADPMANAVTIRSAGPSYVGNLTRWIDENGNTITTVSSFGNIFNASWMGFVEMTAPATPGANNVRLYGVDKAGASELAYKNDAGTVRDLSLLGTIPAYISSSLAASITSAVSIANSATETQLIGLTIPANTLVAGSTLFFAATGIAGTTLIAPTMTWRVRIGASSLSGNIAASWAPTPGTSLSNKGWRIDGEITVRTAGGSGTCIANGLLSDELSSTLTDAVKLSDQTSAVALDTTASRVLEITMQFGTADAANTLTCATAFIGWAKP